MATQAKSLQSLHRSVIIQAIGLFQFWSSFGDIPSKHKSAEKRTPGGKPLKFENSGRY